MIKQDIIKIICRRSRLPRTQAAAAVQATLTELKEALQRGEQVQITGFGRFAVRQKLARVGRNPKTGDSIMISTRNVLTFKPSKLFRERLSGPTPLQATITKSPS